MNLLTGIALAALAAFCYLKYRPRSRAGRGLCGLTLLMAALAAGAGTGNWKFQLLQTGLMAVVGFCCAAQLRRESILRARRSVRRRLHRPVRRGRERPARIA